MQYNTKNNILGWCKLMIGSRIAEMRHKLGWSQLRLAKAVNVSTKSIKNWESELSEPSLKNVVQLARVFSVTTDYLLEIEDSPTIRVEGLSEKDQKYLRSICQMFISYALDKEQ